MKIRALFVLLVLFDISGCGLSNSRTSEGELSPEVQHADSKMTQTGSTALSGEVRSHASAESTTVSGSKNGPETPVSTNINPHLELFGITVDDRGRYYCDLQLTQSLQTDAWLVGELIARQPERFMEFRNAMNGGIPIATRVIAHGGSSHIIVTENSKIRDAYNIKVPIKVSVADISTNLSGRLTQTPVNNQAYLNQYGKFVVEIDRDWKQMTVTRLKVNSAD